MIGWTITFFIILWFSTMGAFIGTELEDKAFIIGSVNTIIITLIMMAVPTLFKFFKKEIEFNKWKKICKWNSIIIFFISIIISAVLFEGELYGIGGLGALMFYFINKWSYFMYEKSDIENEIEYTNTDSNKEKKDMPKYFKEDDEDEDEEDDEYYCYVHKGIITSVVVIILILIGIVIWFGNKINNLEVIIENKNKQYNSLKVDETYYKDKYNEYLEKMKLAEEKINFYDDAIVFVIEGFGRYYYTYDQMEIVTQGIGEYNYWAYNVEQAIAKGYRAWK